MRETTGRSRRAGCLLACAAVVAAVIFAGAQPHMAAAKPPMETSASVVASMAPATESDPRFGVVQAFTDALAASRIGVRWERVTFWWKEMQPSGPTSWNYFATEHDKLINQELRAGRSVVGLLINTPDWAATNPALHGIAVPRGLYLPYNSPNNYWGHFVALMAQHYAGRIDDWVIWNEVSIPSGQWHTWAGTRADYAQLVRVAYQAAKSVNPHAQIILAGDPYWYDHGSWFADTVQRLARMPGASENNSYFDAVNLHLYNRPTDLAPIIDQYRAVLSANGIAKPIWLGETNAIPYNDPARRYPRTGFFASLDDQASYIVDTYAIALALGVQRIEVNRMTDGTDFTAGGEPLGLLRNDGSARPALFAYRTVSDLFSQVDGGSMQFDQRTGVYTVALHKGAESITVLWDQHPEAIEARVRASATDATLYDKWGNGHPVRSSNGDFTLDLAGATGNTDPNDPEDYVMGGNPLILVQR